jgi:2-oxoglutarate ferredoxin oxidoreductase subunit alpha
VKLLLGNEALASGAIAGGVAFFAGFPLAASSEIDLAFVRALPERGGASVFVEDTAAAAGAALGAGAGGTLGAAALTDATFGAAEELLRYALDARLPGLFAVVGGRADDSSRVESAVQDVASLLRLGSPGMPAAPVWAPASSAECHVAARAAALEARARSTPVLIYVDDVIAHLREPVEMTGARESAPADAAMQSAAADSLEAAELYRTRDATVLVVAFGIVARAARTAVRLAREQGIRAGLFRPVRLHPFPHAELADAVRRSRSLIVAELNDGVLWEAISSRREGMPRGASRSLAEPIEGMITPERILSAIEAA